MDYAAVIAQTYQHLENDNVEGAVMGCLRLARHLNDYLNIAFFLHDLSTDNLHNTGCFAADTAKLTTDAARKIWDRATDQWIASRTLDQSIFSSDDHLPEDEQRRVLMISVGTMGPEIAQCERRTMELNPPAGMTPFDTAAFWDSATKQKSLYGLRIQAIRNIKARVKARCFNYVVELERQLAAEQKPVNFLHETQNQVNNYFKANSQDVYNKLQKASQLVDTRDTEDYSLLLTEVRRAIKAVADHFYPPSTKLVKCADGKERVLDDEQYLNRLHEYLLTTFSASSSKQLLVAEFEPLAVFARKLNDISSKGVHANVTAAEGKQGLLGLYMLLSNVIAKLQEKEPGN